MEESGIRRRERDEKERCLGRGMARACTEKHDTPFVIPLLVYYVCLGIHGSFPLYSNCLPQQVTGALIASNKKPLKDRYCT